MCLCWLPLNTGALLLSTSEHQMCPRNIGHRHHPYEYAGRGTRFTHFTHSNRMGQNHGRSKKRPPNTRQLRGCSFYAIYGALPFFATSNGKHPNGQIQGGSWMATSHYVCPLCLKRIYIQSFPPFLYILSIKNLRKKRNKIAHL